jgi:FkbM family methyltransferase
MLYCGIFGDGEYDIPIRRAIERTRRSNELNVLDLGANVGFFALRLLDTVARECGRDARIAATLVEGSPSNAAELRRRLGSVPRVDIVHGLAGRRDGRAHIFEHAFHAANSVNNPVMAREGKRTDVAYVDIAALTARMPRIDLLKCDIEGSELDFLESYPDVLARTDAVVLELHPGICDAGRCRQVLDAAGLRKASTLREAADQSVEYFERSGD